MVNLVPMSEAEYREYTSRAVAEYAAEHVRTGDWSPAEAPERSAKEFAKLLPQGTGTEDQYLYSVFDGETGVHVGMIWFGVKAKGHRPVAFIYDFLILEEFRQRGYGRAALEAVDGKARELGLKEIELHVFGSNQNAFSLYRAVGYEVSHYMMKKKLSPAPK